MVNAIFYPKDVLTINTILNLGRLQRRFSFKSIACRPRYYSSFCWKKIDARNMAADCIHKLWQDRKGTKNRVADYRGILKEFGPFVDL